MIELRPYIEMLERSLPLQEEEPDAITDGKRLKKIMLSEAEWTVVSDLVSLLEPFDDVTKLMSGSSYPTMSVVFPTIVALKNMILNETSNRGQKKSVNSGIQAESDVPSLGIDLIEDPDLFGDDNANASDDDEDESPIETEGLVAKVREKMGQYFGKYYNVSQWYWIFCSTVHLIYLIVCSIVCLLDRSFV